MSTVCTTTLLRRLVDLDVFDDQVASVETFGVGVCFCVLEEAEEELGGFLGPAGFGDTEVLAYNIIPCQHPSVFDLVLSVKVSNQWCSLRIPSSNIIQKPYPKPLIFSNPRRPSGLSTYPAQFFLCSLHTASSVRPPYDQ